MQKGLCINASDPRHRSEQKDKNTQRAKKQRPSKESNVHGGAAVEHRAPHRKIVSKQSLQRVSGEEISTIYNCSQNCQEEELLKPAGTVIPERAPVGGCGAGSPTAADDGSGSRASSKLLARTRRGGGVGGLT